MTEMRQRIIAVMATVFEMDAADIPENAAPGSIEKWDSLKHMNLILALEDEFQLRFSDDEIMDLLNLPIIISIVCEKCKVPHE